MCAFRSCGTSCIASPADGACRSRSRSGRRSGRRRADPCACRSGADEQTSGALHSIAQALTRMQDAMVTMKEKTQRTDAAVRSVAQRLRAHGEAMGKLDTKMNAYERVAVPEREDGASASSSAASFDLGALPPQHPGAPARARARARPCPPAAAAEVSCRDIFKGQLCALRAHCRARSASCPAGLRPSRGQASCPGRDNLSCKAAVYLDRGPCALPCHKDPCPAPCREPAKPYCSCMRRFQALCRKLLKASRDGRPTYVRYLLDAGADVNYASASGWTPLHRAASRAHPGVLHLLVKRGANVLAKTELGFTPLQLAAYHDYSGRCVALLVDKGADVHARTRGGKTALHFAAESGNGAAVRALRAAGASLMAKDNEGRTPHALARTASLRRLLRVCARRRRQPPSLCIKAHAQSSLCDLTCHSAFGL